MYFSPVNLSSSVIQLVPTGNTFQKFQPFPALKGWFKKIDMNISINLPFLLRGHPCFCLDVGVYLTAVLHMWHTIQTLVFDRVWHVTHCQNPDLVSYCSLTHVTHHPNPDLVFDTVLHVHIAQILTWCLTAVLHMWHTAQIVTRYLSEVLHMWQAAQTLTCWGPDCWSHV